MEVTLKTLNKLLVGDRFWFWFCTKVESGHPAMLITPYGDDPDMVKIIEEEEQNVVQMFRDCVEEEKNWAEGPIIVIFVVITMA